MCFFPRDLVVYPKDAPPHVATVSCGHCLDCLQSKSREWQLRIMHESSQYDKNCFITLTYNDDHLPVGGSLVKRDLQLFLKRLRFAISPCKVRYFACGEYGSRGKRPHYHLIIFNWFPDDAYFFERTKKGEVIFRSPTLEKLWTFGFSSVGNVTPDSAKYCAKYLQKLQEPLKGCIPSFTLCSTHPGIGFNKISSDVLTSGCYYVEGHPYTVPRYYLKVLEREGVSLDGFKASRTARAEQIARSAPSVLMSRYERSKKFFGKS